MHGEDAALRRAREDLRAKLGPAALVDTAAVVGNFERMVRIADATGIPLDAPLAVLSQELRTELGVEQYRSASNTPRPRRSQRVLGRVVEPLLHGGMRLVGVLRRARGE